ncbi:unnamed protein product, partial [Strongylus vulgaris]
CEPTHQFLINAGFLAASISAQISQKDRDSVIEKLRQNKLKVLVSTDLIARGIDASNVNLVVNLETAINAETYFHRIGRAARYGGYGAAVTIIADSREFNRFKAMVARGGVSVRMMDLDDIPANLTTNQSYFQRCPVFSPSQADNFNFHPRKDNENNLNHKSKLSPERDTFPDRNGSPSNNTVYNRQTLMEIAGSNNHTLDPSLLDHFKKIEISRDLSSAKTDYENEAAELDRQLSIQKNSVPASQTLHPLKYKFIPSRDKARKKFYLRGELLSIRDAMPKESWRTYALSK